MNNFSNPRMFRWPSWQRSLRYYYVRLLRLQSSPAALARGLAVGAFSGMFPFFGLQTAIALGLAIPFQGNKLVAMAATWISNPFTYVPIYWFNYKLGQVILQWEGPDFQEINWQSGNLWEYTSQAAIALLLGSFVAGLGVSLGAYVLGLRGFHWLHQRRSIRIKRY